MSPALKSRSSDLTLKNVIAQASGESDKKQTANGFGNDSAGFSEVDETAANAEEDND